MSEGDSSTVDLDARLLPFGLGFVCIGLVLIGAFLPVWDEGSVAFSSISENSSVQSDFGWATLVLAGGCAISLLRVLQRPRRIYWPLVSGLLVVGAAIYAGTSEDVLTLCPIGATSTLAEGCQVAEPGIGTYVTGLGGAALIASGWFFLRLPGVTRSVGSPAAAGTRECPHCGSEMRADAMVCPACLNKSDRVPADL